MVCLGLVNQLEIAPRDLTLGARRIIGTLGGTGMFGVASDLIARNHQLFRSLITHTYPLAEAQSALDTASNTRGAIKVQLQI